MSECVTSMPQVVLSKLGHDRVLVRYEEEHGDGEARAAYAYVLYGSVEQPVPGGVLLIEWEETVPPLPISVRFERREMSLTPRVPADPAVGDVRVGDVWRWDDGEDDVVLLAPDATDPRRPCSALVRVLACAVDDRLPAGRRAWRALAFGGCRLLSRKRSADQSPAEPAPPPTTRDGSQRPPDRVTIDHIARTVGKTANHLERAGNVEGTEALTALTEALTALLESTRTEGT